MANIIRREEISCQGRYGSYKKFVPVVLCHCGKEVRCTGFTNTCECGSDYNFAGQQLAPRSQWGEETGETADDILNIP